MAITERSPGLLTIIRAQQRRNLADPRLMSDSWNLYGNNCWFNKRSIADYQKNFDRVLKKTSIVDLVRKKPKPVVIDLMSPSDMLASLFMDVPNKDKLGIAVSFRDKRTQEQIQRDEQLGIHQVAGDIMNASTWRMINKKLEGRKADLIMEQALIGGGLDCIPVRGKFYAVMLNKIWHMLNDQDGTFIGEIDSTRYGCFNMITTWAQYASVNGVHTLYDPYRSIIRITKGPYSPKDLSFLFQKPLYPPTGWLYTDWLYEPNRAVSSGYARPY